MGITYSSLDRIVLQGPPQILTTTPGIYQETEPNFTFSGAWVQVANAAAINGGWRYTIQKDAALTFSIDSSVTRMVISRTTGPGYGSMQVLLDGGLISTISNVSATVMYGQPAFVSVAIPGTHVVTIKNVAATNSSIDQIALLGTATAISTTTPSATGTYEETESNFNYTGTWVRAANTLALGGAYRYTTAKDATVSFTVDGTASRVVIYRTMGPAPTYGSMDVSINGSFVVNISNINPTVIFGQPYVLNILTPGTNTIEIKNKAATNSNIDRIVLLGAPATLTTTPGTYQENDPALTYTGNWIQATNAAALSSGYRYTTATGATVSFKIDSSVTRIVIYRTIGLGYGSMDVFNELSTTVPIATISNVSTSTLFGQPIVVPITAGSHTITIKNKAATNSNIDQIVLLGDPATLAALGTYQENDTNFTYIGNWIQVNNALALSGGYRYTIVKDANLTFKIDTTLVKRIAIYRTASVGYGSMDVLIDNNPVANINNVGTTLSYGQPFVVDVSGLSVGTHTIKINNKAATNSNIDQIVLLGAPETLTALGTYQESDPNFTYTGNWIQATNASALSGAYRYTIVKDANLTFSIDTTSVKRIAIYRTIGIGYGSMDVSIDNNFVANINNVGTATLFGQPFVVDVSGLSVGTHTVKINNKAATNSNIDQIVLLGNPDVLTPSLTPYQENDINLTYTGNWIQATNVSALSGAYRYTMVKDATVSFQINPSVTRMIIYRTTGLGYGTMELFDETAPTTPFATISNVSTTTLFGQPYVVTIPSPAAHTITIKNKAATNSNIDQIVLLGTAQELGAGVALYQETDSHLFYGGKWTQAANVSMLGGAWSYTTQAGANVSFPINSTVSRVVLSRATGVAPTYGSLQVFLDGATTPLTTISNVSTTALYGQTWVINIATPGSHILTLKNVAATNSNIDQIQLLGAPTALTILGSPYQESDLNLTYSGTWTQSQNAAAFLGARRSTVQLGASVKFSVESTVTRVVIFRTTGPAPTYGSMQVLLDGNTTPAATISNVSTTVQYGQPYFLDVAAGGHTIELKNVAATSSDIDQIVLLGAAPTLTTAQVYEESDPAFAYTGTWARAAGTGPSGGAAYYTYKPGSTVTFSFTGQAFSLYYASMVGGGNFTVKIDAGAAIPFSAKTTTTQWQQILDFGSLTNTTHTVVITNTSPTSATFVYFDAIRIIDVAAPLTVGEYQNTYPSLTYTGTWAVDPITGQSAGAATVTTQPNDQMTFTFTGTGFGVMTDNVPTGATMRICYTGPMTSTCNNTNDYSTVLNPKQLNVGYTFYNLKPGTYTVTVKHVGTAGQGLYIDRIFVLDTPPTTLVAGTYENTAAGIVYSPSSLWTTAASASYSGGSIRAAIQKGAMIQVKFNGSTMIVYQVASPTATKTLNICSFLTDSAGTPITLCTTYSQRQSLVTSFVAPVAFYGFGSGNHEVMIENATAGSQFNVDKILVK